MLRTRSVEVLTPLGPQGLLFRRLTAVEELGRPFELRLTVLARDEGVDFDALLGRSVTVALALPDGRERYWNGLTTGFSQTGRSGAYAVYQATLRPWLWFLTRSADCRIFQGKTVPDIVKTVFRDHGFTDFDEALGGDYRTRDYCVQYRETDFNFVSRLLEQEGIYYFFRHTRDKHTLVLADAYSAHEKASGYERIPYYPPSENVVRETDYLDGWVVSREVQPGVFALNDFDFERPRAGLLVKAPIRREHPHADLEVYDYPGEYVTAAEGDAYAKTRIEELQTRFETVQGRGNARGIAAGGLFELTGFPRSDQNREYLVTSAVHRLETPDYESNAAASGGPVYACEFTALDARQPFRPARATPRPLVQGPQTAIVVGKAGEEIWTDRYGRVKVQFHWDRLGRSDENSSCWVRVAQLWAGANWGAVHVPRIGQEVVVDFLEGDPDRPLVTGRVYNADNMPPYALPANMTQSGVKSRSTKQGSPENANELRFEDKKGEELLTLHAERDQAISVENDESHTVGHDRVKEIGNDETTTVRGNRTETVEKDESITIRGKRTESVAKEESIAIGESRTENVTGDESITIGGARTESVTGDESVTVGGNRDHTVSKEDLLSVGRSLTVKAGDQVVFTVGSARVVMKKDGSITLTGSDIRVEGDKVTLKASGELILKGSTISQN